MHHLGSHLLHIEGDFMSLQWNGEFYPEDLRGLLRAVDEALDEHGRLFVLIDATRAGKVQADARKQVVGWRSRRGAICAVFFGASFPVRVVANTVAAAARLLNGNELLPLHFVATEEAARSWLDAQRLVPR